MGIIQKDKNTLSREDALNMLANGGHLVVAGDLSTQRNMLQAAIKYNDKVYVILSEEMPQDFCWALL